ncbi:MAG: ADP-ribose-binding protein [Infirmifilum sp.]
MSRVVFPVSGKTIEVLQGDITELEVDVIVNAANSYLKHGGGVALAIVRKGGDQIQRESDEYVSRYGPVPTGEVAVTGAGRLKARYVIHAVGPRYGDPDGDKKLASAFANALFKADELGAKSVALPAISTGVYGYPLVRCAEIAARVILENIVKLRNLEKIVFCLYGEEAFQIFTKVFGDMFKGYLQS